jgi:hypothetical protein
MTFAADPRTAGRTEAETKGSLVPVKSDLFLEIASVSILKQGVLKLFGLKKLLKPFYCCLGKIKEE